MKTAEELVKNAFRFTKNVLEGNIPSTQQKLVLQVWVGPPVWHSSQVPAAHSGNAEDLTGRTILATGELIPCNYLGLWLLPLADNEHIKNKVPLEMYKNRTGV